MKGSAIFGEEDEYEVKEVEQSRAAEFHASSSSEDEGESDDCNRRDFHERTKFQLQMERSALGRPKTAAKDLEKYRDVVPSDFFQQFEGATTPDGAESPPSNFAKATSSRTDNSVQNSARVLSARRDGSNQLKYKAAVPRDVEELFSLTDAYTPEDVEIETRLEPFLPEFTPAVGLPFITLCADKIPRPDGKEDKLGVEVLREPSGQTNVAELELLMQISMTNQHKLRSRGDVVRSIEWAARRPQELDQWIASVEKVQRTKPLAQVNYKQAMPPLAQLMELWPEEFEDFLAAQKATVPTLSELDVNLKELAKVVCALLDIPVYEGNCVQSLHLGGASVRRDGVRTALLEFDAADPVLVRVAAVVAAVDAVLGMATKALQHDVHIPVVELRLAVEARPRRVIGVNHRHVVHHGAERQRVLGDVPAHGAGRLLSVRQRKRDIDPGPANGCPEDGYESAASEGRPRHEQYPGQRWRILRDVYGARGCAGRCHLRGVSVSRPIAGEAWCALAVDFAVVRAQQHPHHEDEGRQDGEHEAHEKCLAQREV
ncbi:hypothetical protein ON010_g16527 [Phytophthora cinnamomi]|nr:hypothetical protein ON010_g16527 [Phytophthora cinnamomi]